MTESVATHITARLAWHNDGWNGNICLKPAENTFCIGCYSYPGDMIAERRDLTWEQQHGGEPIPRSGYIAPCIYSANAFGSEARTAFADPPKFFNDGTQTRLWDLPPSSVCVWPYEEMYDDDVKSEGGLYDNVARRERAKAYFAALDPGSSLIFYYANYSNPLSEDEARRYLLVGVSRVKEVGEELMYSGCSERTIENFGGGFVWDRTVTSHYPEQGVRLPYHLYRDRSELMERFAISPENPRTCKYGSRHLSDDDALGMIEQFLGAVETLQQMGDQSEDWEVRKHWLQCLVAELWKSRGLYPGMPAVLEVLGFADAIPYFKREALAGKEKEAFEQVFALIEGNNKDGAACGISDDALRRLTRSWKLRYPTERDLLKEVLARFDLSAEQMRAILSPDRRVNGIASSYEDMTVNPYVLAEEYVGDSPDDVIPWSRIDRGMLPSPELGGTFLAQLDDARRMRSLAVEQLRRQAQQTFMPAAFVLQAINFRLALLPEYKRHIFTDRYWEVDEEFLNGALHLRTEADVLYVYLRFAWEDERYVEEKLRFLLSGPDIVLKRPITEDTWREYLFESESVLAKKARVQYEVAIANQIAICGRVFLRPVTVLAGAAGTGKTTVIRALVKAVRKVHGVGTPVTALAPTGKAADRIREVLEQDGALAGVVQTSTIHSFLAKRGWLNENMTFKREGGTVERDCSTYIIDESSMLDLTLASALFRSIDWRGVQRLILVGDPNQLPPIGRGRVFADVIEHFRTREPDSLARLSVNLRQLAGTISGDCTGILDLAAGYQVDEAPETKDQGSDDRDEDLLRKVQEGGAVSKDLTVVYWNNAEELAPMLMDCMVRDMEKATGTRVNPETPYSLWRQAFDGKPERYQVLTPFRGELFGLEALNRAVQAQVSGGLIEWRGELDGITLFDKVIQTRNRPASDQAYAWVVDSKKNGRVEIYNGELGFVKVHGLDTTKWKRPYFHFDKFQVCFSRKPNHWVNYGRKLGAIKLDDGKERWIPNQKVEDNLELAYAISVHKAQGSEFDQTYVILPKDKGKMLSPELVYTALTRAKQHCTLFVEQDITSLLATRRRERSSLLGINSSLFAFHPVAEPLLKLSSFDAGRIHESLLGCMVRSKSEVIVANLLAAKDIAFQYEVPLFAPDGTFYLPDFTIEWRGQRYFWEHLGMLDKPEYKSRWDKKAAWYAKHFEGALLTTSESPYLSRDAEKLITQTFV